MENDLKVLQDTESYTFPEQEGDLGNYSVAITRLPYASNISFVFTSEESANSFEQKIRTASVSTANTDEQNLWGKLRQNVESIAKIARPREETTYPVNIVANQDSAQSFNNEVIRVLVDLKLIPSDEANLLPKN